MGYGSTEQYICFYSRLTCVHVESAHLTPSTAPPLPCETHPAQRPSVRGDCVQSDIRAFGIAGSRKAAALKAEVVWIETVTEGGRRFMAVWRRKEEMDAARYRQ